MRRIGPQRAHRGEWNLTATHSTTQNNVNSRSTVGIQIRPSAAGEDDVAFLHSSS